MGDAHLSCFLLSAPQGFVARGRKEPIFQGTQAQSDGHARQQALRALFTAEVAGTTLYPASQVRKWKERSKIMSQS
jgi:hypothetical protein